MDTDYEFISRLAAEEGIYFFEEEYLKENAKKLAYQRPEYEIFDYPGRFKDEQHGADFAKYQVEGWRNNVDFACGARKSPWRTTVISP